MAQNEIFISYAWKGESEAVVDQLCAAFAAHGYSITRDKSTMTYKDSIHEFMERIGRGKFIIAVVNDKYMKSEYCMYEAYRMFQSPEFKARIFPIVLPDADIFSFRGQAAYLKHWSKEYKALEAEYREIAELSPTMVAPLTERLKDIEITTRFINDFMAAVSDMNVLTSQMHLDSDFEQLFAAIEKRMQAAESDAEKNDTATSAVDKASQGERISAQNTGGGAIAQGAGAKAVGQGGVLIDGDFTGNLTIGNNNKINNK